MSEEVFNDKSAGNFNAVSSALKHVLNGRRATNECCFAAVRLPEMHDVLPYALARDGENFERWFGQLIDLVEDVLRNAASRKPFAVKAVRQIRAALLDHPALPASLRERAAVVAYRAPE